MGIFKNSDQQVLNATKLGASLLIEGQKGFKRELKVKVTREIQPIDAYKGKVEIVKIKACA